MNHTVYLKLNQITELTHKDVVLKDVAQVYCDDQNVMNKCNSMKVMTVKVDAKRRYIMSALDVINKLKQLDSTIDVNNVGETDFIIAYKPPSPPAYIWQWTKTIFVCLVCFFGAAFAIMTFNNDVSVTDVFSEVFKLVMGYESGGFTVLEVSYSIGLAVGLALAIATALLLAGILHLPRRMWAGIAVMSVTLPFPEEIKGRAAPFDTRIIPVF